MLWDRPGIWQGGCLCYGRMATGVKEGWKREGGGGGGHLAGWPLVLHDRPGIWQDDHWCYTIDQASGRMATGVTR